MGKKMAAVLLSVSALGAGAVAERTIDPFERYAHDYSLEGPNDSSDVFYVSSNWYNDAGEKQDDRLGDAIIVFSMLSGLGAAALHLHNQPGVRMNELFKQKEPY